MIANHCGNVSARTVEDQPRRRVREFNGRKLRRQIDILVSFINRYVARSPLRISHRRPVGFVFDFGFTETARREHTIVDKIARVVRDDLTHAVVSLQNVGGTHQVDARSGNSSALSCYNKISVDREFCLISAVEINGTHGKCTAVKGEAGNEISRLIGVKDRPGLKYKFRP